MRSSYSTTAKHSLGRSWQCPGLVLYRRLWKLAMKKIVSHPPEALFRCHHLLGGGLGRLDAANADQALQDAHDAVQDYDCVCQNLNADDDIVCVLAPHRG